jgi:hypothetical protein
VLEQRPVQFGSDVVISQQILEFGVDDLGADTT